MVTVGQLLQGLAHVPEQVPATGDLGGPGRALPGAVGVGAGAVTGDHLDARVALEPAGQGRGRAVGQEVDDAVPLKVAEDGAVALPTPPRPVVDTEHAHLRRGDRCGAGRSHEAQERVAADRHGQLLGQARSGLAAQRQADARLRLAQARGPARLGPRHPGQGLGEDHSRARGVGAA